MSLSNSFLDQITPDSIRAYLTGAGWKLGRGQSDKDRTQIFNCPYKRYAQVELPVDSNGRWYSQSIDQLIKHLAEIEKRDEEAVVFDLQYPQSEIISYRASSSETRLGTIPLGEAGKFVSAVIAILRTVVCDVITPSFQHKKIKCDETDALLKKAHFAQTERGSYVVKVICPLDAIPSRKPLFDNTPIVRQTTMHLMRVASQFVEAIDGNRIGTLIDKIKKDSSPQRVSIDTCNAISRTKLSENCTIDLATRWAPVLKLPSNANIPDKVVITPKHFTEILTVCADLAPQQSESQTKEFIAVVEGCSGESFNDQDQREGLVTLRVFSHKGESLKVKAVLQHDLYVKANQNHIEKKGSYVKIVGSIVSKGRSNEMTVESIEPLNK